ncbi:MAG: hypothetical protein DA408_00740 [Bacteroidetes bacterium]|nr:MAG: hypothetical protein C7N36_21880 [Bacteroidota bacterium]PTM15178.1 MAG: hypothetical protein DA408_00740 [Bacteroidota bacterium]
MNTRKIKLALTAGLINKNTNSNALASVKDLMTSFADEVGHFLGLINMGNASLGSNTIRESYALRYENCTLNVDLVSQANRQTIQGFNLR